MNADKKHGLTSSAFICVYRRPESVPRDEIEFDPERAFPSLRSGLKRPENLGESQIS
jgi:hypothetical protein